MGPKVKINAIRVALVATVFARGAIATFPPARRSPMMPEPTTAASRKAVPSASLAARRSTAFLGGKRLHGADESAHKFPFDLESEGVGIDTFAGEKLPGVREAVNAGGLDIDAVETRLRQL